MNNFLKEKKKKRSWFSPRLLVSFSFALLWKVGQALKRQQTDLFFFLKVTTFIGEHRNMDGTFPLVHVIIPFLILFFF